MMTEKKEITSKDKLRRKILDYKSILDARYHILPFTQYTFHDIYKPSFFHINYANKLQDFIDGKIKRLIITIPPQHGKSELSSRRMPAYLFGKNPNLRIGLISYNDSIAGKFNRDIKRIMKGEEYGKVFPKSAIGKSRENYDTDNSTEFTINGHQGDFVSVGVGGSLTSRKLDIAIIDDLYKDWEQAKSHTYRETVWNWYSSVLETRLHNESQVCIIMTRWHSDDLVGRIKKGIENGTIKEDWEEVHYEAIKESPKTDYDPREMGEALWEEMHSREKLLGLRSKNPAVFDALNQGSPRASKTNKFFSDCSVFDKEDSERNFIDGTYELDKSYPVLLSFDFNSNPCSVILAQYPRHIGLRVVKTITADGGIGKLLPKLQFLKDNNYALRVVGDNNGHRRVAETSLTCFAQIRQSLGVTAEPITKKANKLLVYSGELVNYIMTLNGLLKIAKDGNELLIHDLKETLANNVGGINKSAHDPHAADCLRYLIHYLFPRGVEDAWMEYQYILDINQRNQDLQEKHQKTNEDFDNTNPIRIKLG